MTLHPANVQDAHRTPVPDVSVGRARVEGDGRTYVYASVRPVGPIRSRSTVTSFVVPSPIAHSFHVRPRCDARELSNPEAFATTPVPSSCHLFHARCHLARGKGTGVQGLHSRCTLTVTPAAYTLPDANGCGHIISTIDAIMARNGNPTDAPSMSPPPPL